jgi:hypothetical protein
LRKYVKLKIGDKKLKLITNNVIDNKDLRCVKKKMESSFKDIID